MKEIKSVAVRFNDGRLICFVVKSIIHISFNAHSAKLRRCFHTQHFIEIKFEFYYKLKKRLKLVLS